MWGRILEKLGSEVYQDETYKQFVNLALCHRISEGKYFNREMIQGQGGRIGCMQNHIEMLTLSYENCQLYQALHLHAGGQEKIKATPEHLHNFLKDKAIGS